MLFRSNTYSTRAVSCFVEGYPILMFITSQTDSIRIATRIPVRFYQNLIDPINFNLIVYPPPCRKAPLRAQAHAEGTSHYLQSSSSSSHPVLFAVGVWRSSWSWSLQFQLKSESGVPSLETSKGGPPPCLACGCMDPYPPEAPNFSLWPPIFAIWPHLGALA